MKIKDYLEEKKAKIADREESP
ncbi:hypothetical protein AB3S75_047168 [Citrus x aurantiifolia]